MIKHILILYILITMLGFFAPTIAMGLNNGTIEGNATNRTTDNGTVINQEIRLTTYKNNTEIDSIISKTDTKGHFVFNNLSTDPEYSYEVGTEYQDISYYTDLISFKKDETSILVEVTVYDTTTDDKTIQIGTAHTIISFDEGNLHVMEYILFINKSNRAFIGTKENAKGFGRETLLLLLPDGATELEYDVGLVEGEISGKGLGLIDVTPVLPGEKEVVYSYKLIPTSNSYTVYREVIYPTAKFDLLVQGQETQIVSDRMVKRDPVKMESSVFSHFDSNNLIPGSRIEFTLTNLPQPGILSSYKWLAPGLIIAVISMIIVFLYIQIRRKPKHLKKYESQGIRQKLLTEMADLDDLYESEQIPEKNYVEKREKLKTRLIELTKKGGKGSKNQ